jgi:hypothetical protein
MRGKKISCRQMGKKYRALHFYRKKIHVLFPWVEKILAQSESSNPNPLKIKWSAPKACSYMFYFVVPLISYFWKMGYFGLGSAKT